MGFRVRRKRAFALEAKSCVFATSDKHFHAIRIAFAMYSSILETLIARTETPNPRPRNVHQQHLVAAEELLVVVLDLVLHHGLTWSRWLRVSGLFASV